MSLLAKLSLLVRTLLYKVIYFLTNPREVLKRDLDHIDSLISTGVADPEHLEVLQGKRDELERTIEELDQAESAKDVAGLLRTMRRRDRLIEPDIEAELRQGDKARARIDLMKDSD